MQGEYIPKIEYYLRFSLKSSLMQHHISLLNNYSEFSGSHIVWGMLTINQSQKMPQIVLLYEENAYYPLFRVTYC